MELRFIIHCLLPLGESKIISRVSYGERIDITNGIERTSVRCGGGSF